MLIFVIVINDEKNFSAECGHIKSVDSVIKRMKIVFFEVQNWEKKLLLSAFPKSILTHEKLTIDNASRYQEAKIISCFIYSALNAEVLKLLPHLVYIGTRSTGYDHIDVDYCKKNHILVTNVPEYGTNTVAEHTFALILSLTRKIYQSINQSKNLNFDQTTIRGIDLYGKTLGIVGLGKIGQQVLRIAKGFQMNVLVYNRTKDSKLAQKLDFQYVELEVLLARSDIVSLHLALNEHTKHIVNKKRIGQFKKGAYLVNTARGGLIETEAIIDGLEQQILEGVGLDVLEEEKELNEEIAILSSEYKRAVDLKTLVYNHILINHPKVLITPHNAFNSVEALHRIANTSIKNMQNFIVKRLKDITVV